MKRKDDWVKQIPKDILTKKHAPCDFGTLIQPALHFDVKKMERDKRTNKRV